MCTEFVDFESWPGPLPKINLNVAAKSLKIKQH